MDRWSTELLEFEALKDLLARYVSSPLGHELLDRIEPTDDRSFLIATHAETDEAIGYERICRQAQPGQRGAAVRLRFDSLPDPSAQLGKLSMQGAVLEAKEIVDLLSLLDRASEVRMVLTSNSARFPRLAVHADRIGEFRPMLRELEGKILPDGTVADHASVALGRIRRDMERQQRLIHESLERFQRAHRDTGVLQEDFVAIRNERFVLPVVAGQKRKVEGIIHAASGTGQTLFIEPMETIELNNDLVRLREQEMREVHRILTDITARFAAAGPEIQASMDALAEIEILFAKARMAVDFGCTVPRFSLAGEPRIAVRDASHPLLEDVLRRKRASVVPLTLTLDSSTRTLLISGPNTGGKTVALKTIGLLVLMAQSGLPVPAAEAEFPVFEQVLADIGDNQSIEQSLSTFSAHIMRIREMVEMLKPSSLVLLDELGRATDPDEGGALGVAILDRMHKSGAFTLASTHLLAPKIYGANTDGVLNASMSFDEATLAPTYILRTGAPGASAGLDIARRLGLSESLIEQARAALSTSQRDIAHFLKLIEERLDSVTTLEADLRRQKDALTAEQAGLKQLWEKRESAKLKELERRSELLFEQFQAKAEETIEQIVAGAEQRKAAANARRKVSQTGRELREEFDNTVVATRGESGMGQLARPKVTEGVRVRLRDVREPARVRRIMAHDMIEVEAGFLKIQVPLDDVLEVLPDAPAPGSKLPKNVTLRSGPEFAVLTREINVIGKRAEEACQEVDKFLDQSVLASVGRVRIVHGHGMGILKRAIADLLKGHPHVASFAEGSPQEGGTGATVVELRTE